MEANQPKLCGICCALHHPTDTCPTFQEIEHAIDVYAMQSRQSFRPQQQ